MEKDFLKFVAKVMEIDETEISLSTRYNEIPEWDSMMMLTLIMEIESEYSKNIPLEKVSEIKSLKDLYNMVVND